MTFATSLTLRRYILSDYGIDLPGKKDIGAGIKKGNEHYAMTEVTFSFSLSLDFLSSSRSAVALHCSHQTFSVDNLRAFVEAYFAGSLEAKIKEEPDYSSQSHEDEDDGEDDGTPSSVVTLTSENFDSVVNAPGVDVMVEFYAPWCGHCMQLKPTYKKLAAAFEGVDTVTIAAMDATAHDPPASYDVAGYPTIFFVKGDAAKTPVSYDGGRDLGSMVEYIKANAATKIKDEL
jgi:protein disulfide-isomerase-like protein